MILLDTSCLIDFFRGSPEAYSCIKGRSYAVTAISCHEILAGVKRTKAKREEEFFRDFFKEVIVLEYTIEAAEESSSVSASLAALGKPVNALDILIAGTAISEGIRDIATRDSDFLVIAKVTDLNICTY